VHYDLALTDFDDLAEQTGADQGWSPDLGAERGAAGIVALTESGYG
jgi:hypothetical protein